MGGDSTPDNGRDRSVKVGHEINNAQRLSRGHDSSSCVFRGTWSHALLNSYKLQCGPMSNVIAALPNISDTLCWTPNFGWCPLLECRAVTLPIFGERKTWTQSEFCTWQNSVIGQELPKMYTQCISPGDGQTSCKVRLKPNSVTIAGSELVRSWFEAGLSWYLAYHLAC